MFNILQSQNSDLIVANWDDHTYTVSVQPIDGSTVFANRLI